MSYDIYPIFFFLCFSFVLVLLLAVIRRAEKERKDLYDRLMAKDFKELKDGQNRYEKTEEKSKNRIRQMKALWREKEEKGNGENEL